MRKLFSRSAWVVVAFSLVATMVLAGDRGEPPVGLTPAADLGQFNPGNIISDAIFFDGGAMNGAQIQSFLNLKGISCKPGSDGTPCLKNFTQDTTPRPADAYCAGYSPSPGESAATILAKVGVSCGINPAVLMVMLQKEQGLVLGTGSGLYAMRYQKAMGYACPDSAPCDAAYYGFQNQVYAAARRFKVYGAEPGSYGYRAGRTSNVLYQVAPNDPTKFNYQARDCGSSPVYIQNQATANLYIYTPYQPNAAALAAGYGTGDACSAYGNRNFWLYFTDWFGSTQLPGQSVWNPVGALDPLTAVGRLVTVSGWAVDPNDVNGFNPVHVYVDGVGAAILRADQYSTATEAYNGYSVKLPMAPGVHSVCTYGINVGAGSSNTGLGCRQVTVGAAMGDNPTGFIEAATSGRSVAVSGWSLDPNSVATPIDVHVYVDGVGVAIARAGSPGAPTAAAFEGAGGDHAFGVTVGLRAGSHEICGYGINLGAGVNAFLGCRTVYLDPAAYNPVGAWETSRLTGPDLLVAGWAQDLDTPGATQVHAYVDGVGTVLSADRAHAQVSGHGFETTLRLTPGNHSVCLYSINVGDGTANVLLGCRSVAVDKSAFNPVGALESVSAVGGTMSLAGWVTDPDIPTGAVPVHVYVDGQPRAVLSADQANPAAPGHGYAGTLTLTEGAHSVCAYGINIGQGSTNVLLGCTPITVTSNPTGALESVTSVGGLATLSGWVTDPDIPTGAVPVHVYVDGQPRAVLSADQANPAAPGHGYSTSLTLAEGRRSVCTYGINVGPGSTNVLLGCTTITVTSNPAGALDQPTAVGGAVTVSGWVTDPDIPSGAVPVHVYADGVPVAVLSADQANATAPGHGYTTTLNLTAGEHSVCTYGINIGQGTTNVLLGCKPVTVTFNPVGALDTLTGGAGSATLSGWVTDPDIPAGAVSVHVYADGVPVAVLAADQANATAPGHGYTTTLNLAAGPRSVCTYGINVGQGTTNVLLGCRQVTVS